MLGRVRVASAGHRAGAGSVLSAVNTGPFPVSGGCVMEHGSIDAIISLFSALHVRIPFTNRWKGNSMKFQGTAHKYGRDIDTDVIIPARYLNTSIPEELAKHCMEDLDPEFVKKMRFGDILVAEENFGCGSSREHAPISIKAAGVSVIIAKSFARIFYRNSINTGLPIMESAEAVDGISDGDIVEVDADAGLIRNVTTGQSWQAQPFPPFIKEIIEKGGLIEMVKDKLANR